MKVLSVDGLSKLISLMKEDFVESSSLSTVATSGSYNDLSDKPTIPEGLPSQSGNSGKFLTTNGTTASWGTTLNDTLSLILPDSGTDHTYRAKRGNSCFIIRQSGSSNNVSADLCLGISSQGLEWADAIHLKFEYDRTTSNDRKGYFYPYGNGFESAFLGESYHKWTSIYATKLNNGGDISIPTSSGTLALTSQIPTVATTSTAGLVKPDGTTITITNDGTITAVGGGGGSSYTAGTGIDITNNVISVTSPTLTNKQHNASGSSLVLGSTGSYSNDGGQAIGISHLGYSGWYSLGAGAISIGGLNASGGRAINIGGAQCSGDYSIQLGFGSNTESNSFYVGLSSSNNYKLLGSDGIIPIERLSTMTGADGTNAGTAGIIPAPSATDNTKFLRGDGTWATVSGGGSSLPDQTGQSGKYLTTNGTTASWGTITIPTVDQTYDGTSSNAQSGVAIAGAGFLTNNTSSPYSWVISNTASNQDGLTILGKDSSSTKARSTVLGRSAQSTGKTGIVIGYAAYVSADHAIQIGTGTNSTADTLSIGFDNDTTANRKNWTLLDGTTGLIPDARISTNIARTSDISGKQDISNLVTSLSSSSTDSQYPSAKCVYDLIGNLESILNNINNGNIS